MKKILVIDDDRQNLELLEEMLQGHYQAVLAAGGKDGLLAAVRERPDLILLDINMPDLNGFEVCKRLREQPATRAIPVVMLTTEASLDNRVQGLELGADDYITKPFHIRDLLARIGARLRRVDLDVRREEKLEFANLVLDPRNCEASLNGNPVNLTRVEFDIIRYFVERPDRLIDRNALLRDLWPDAVVTLRTVDTHMGNLRKKLRGFKGALKTVYGGGYILKKRGSG